MARLKSRLARRAREAKAKLDNFQPKNPSLKPLHTDAAFKPRAVPSRKHYKRDKRVIEELV